jgi:hypothetical protein
LREQLGAAWNANVWSALMAVFSPTVEVVPPVGWPESDVARGLTEARGAFKRLKSSWAEETLKVTDLDFHRDRVLLGYTWVTKGEASGVPVAMQMYAVYEIGELIDRAKFFTDRELALSAAGL